MQYKANRLMGSSARNLGIAICVFDLAQPKNKDHSSAQTAQISKLLDTSAKPPWGSKKLRTIPKVDAQPFVHV